MTTTVTRVFVAILLAGAIACNPAAEGDNQNKEPMNMEELKTRIQQKEDALAQAQNNKNIDEALTYYSEDIISYPPNKEPEVGKEVKRERYNEMMSKDTSNTTVRFQVIDVFAEGDLLVETGEWFDVSDAGDETEKGTYMAIFKKENGEYVCIREIWNSKMPKKEKVAEPTEPMETASAE